MNLPSLPAKCFSCSVPDIDFQIGQDNRAHVEMTAGNDTIYDEYLFPLNGIISLQDLSQLLEPYARQQLVVNLTVSVTEESVDSEGTATTVASDSTSTQVVFCMADVGIAEGVTTAEQFCNNHFLTILMGPKRTALGRLEYLHFVGTGGASVTATYSDGSTGTFTATVVGGNGQYTTLDVSPDRFTATGKSLTGYTVTAGSRRTSTCFPSRWTAHRSSPSTIPSAARKSSTARVRTPWTRPTNALRCADWGSCATTR